MSRYSTARSGLLKAARIAASICDLSNPMASMLATASARCSPSISDDGSFRAPASVAPPARAGVGVAGAAAWDVGWAVGAAGAAGVEAAGWAGVAGTFEVEAAGLGSLGCCGISLSEALSERGEISYLVHHAHNKAFLLDLVGLDRLLILQDLACGSLGRG